MLRARAPHRDLPRTGLHLKSGYEAARLAFANSTSLPTAIVAGADNVAFGVMEAAAEVGIKIPADLSLVGYDNTRTAALAPISLTSVDQDPEAMGSKAAELLLSRVAGRTQGEAFTYQPKLVVRGSSVRPRT